MALYRYIVKLYLYLPIIIFNACYNKFINNNKIAFEILNISCIINILLTIIYSYTITAMNNDFVLKYLIGYYHHQL